MDNVSITINDVVESVQITALQSVNTVNITVADLVIPVIEGITAMGIPGNISAFTKGDVVFSGTNLAINTLVQNGSQIIQFSATSPDLSGYRQTANDSQLQFTSANSLFQAVGNYLTTAALSNHNHSDVYLNKSVSDDYRKTVNDSQLQFTSANSLFQAAGNYLTTAAQSNHGHTNYQSTGNYLTTAAESNHTHSNLYINTSKEANFFQAANSSLLQPAGAYLTTAMQSASSSVFAKTGITTASKTGSEMAATLNTDGLSILVPKWVTNAVGGPGGGVALGNIASSNAFTSGSVMFSAVNASVNLSSNGDSQYIQISIGNYLTTGAASDHTHSNLYQSTGNYLTTAMASNESHLREVNASNGSFWNGTLNIRESGPLTINATSNSLIFSVGNYITTGALSDHTHSNLYQSTGNYLTTAMASNANTSFVGLNSAVTGFSATINSSGISLSNPGWLTTAAVSNHTHSDLYQSTGAYLTTAAQSGHTHSDLYINTSKEGNFFLTANSSLLQTAGAYLTTAAPSTHTHGAGSTASTAGTDLAFTTASNNWTLGVPKWITTAALSANTSNYAGIGSTTNSVTGSVMKMTVNTNGVELGVPAWVTNAVGGGAVVGGDYISSSVAGQATHLSVTGLQPSGAYLTTAAASNHTHSDVYVNLSVSSAWQTATLASTFAQTANVMLTGERANYYYTSANTLANSTHAHGNISISATSNATETAMRFTSASSGLTIVQPSFLTTAAASGHTHGAGSTASTAGSDLAFTTASNNWTFGVPKWLTTAALSAQTSNFAGTNTSVLTIAGTDIAVTQNTTGLTIGYPKWITTAALSANTSNYAGIGSTSASITGSVIKMTVNTNGLELGVPAWITTAGVGGGAAIQGSGTYTQNSGTIQFANSNNVTFGLTANSMTASIPIGTVNFSDAGGVTWSSSVGAGASSLSSTIYVGSMAGGGAAVQGSGAYSQNTGTISFANSNGITFGLSTNVMTASYNSTQFAGQGTTTATTSGTDVKLTVNSAGLNMAFPTGNIFFGNISGFSWTSSTAAGNTTFSLKTS